MQYCIDSDTCITKLDTSTQEETTRREHLWRESIVQSNYVSSLGSAQAETKFHLCQHALHVIIVYLLVSGESYCVAGLRRSASRTGPCTAYLLEYCFWDGVFQPKAHEPRRAGAAGAAGACKARATSPAADEASAEH